MMDVYTFGTVLDMSVPLNSDFEFWFLPERLLVEDSLEAYAEPSATDSCVADGGAGGITAS